MNAEKWTEEFFVTILSEPRPMIGRKVYYDSLLYSFYGYIQRVTDEYVILDCTIFYGFHISKKISRENCRRCSFMR